MNDELFTPAYSSSLAQPLEHFLRDKRSRGCTYRREVFHLQQLDRFLAEAGLEEVELPRLLAEQWVAWTVNRKPSTHRKRIIVIRQFAFFMRLQGHAAHIPLLPWTPRRELRSAARIFSRDEIQALFDVADRLPHNSRTPLRHIVLPELFLVLYGCGLRAGEARRLNVVDVDLDSGTLSIHQGKFHRVRLVPVAPGLRHRLQRYAVALGVRPSSSPFFPAPQGRHYGQQGVYCIFKELLKGAGIEHGGRGKGPRPRSDSCTRPAYAQPA